MMNNRIWVLGTVLASIAVIAIGVAVGILPKLSEAGVNTLNLASVQSQNQAYEADLEALKKQFENIDDVRDRLEELRETLPAEGEYPEFVDEVAALAAASGVQVIETGQSAPIVYGATATEGSDTGTAATPISGGTLLAIPYTIRFDSTTPGFNFLFMERLRTGDRLLLITAFDYEIKERNGLTVYEVFLSLYVYTLVDSSAIPATGDDGSAPTDPVPSPDPTASETPGAIPTPSDTATPTDTATPAP